MNRANRTSFAMGVFLIEALLIGALLMGCRELDKEVLISRQAIQETVEKRFPYEHEAVMARLKLHSPKVYFKEKNIGIKLDYEVGFLRREVKGALDFNGELVYRPEQGAFYIMNVRMEGLTANDAILSNNPTMKEMVSRFISDSLTEKPVYTLNTDETKEQLAKRVLKEVRVKGDSLSVILSFKKEP